MERLNNPINKKAVRLAQITDPHLGADQHYIHSGINTYHSLIDVLDAICVGSRLPDLVVSTGDISYNGMSESYTLFQKLLVERRLPFCWLPGNHDDFLVMQQSFSQVPFKPVVSVGNWRLIMVNTSVFNRVEGMISATELQHIEQLLAEDMASPTVVFTHHPPVSVGSHWVDAQQIQNGEQLLELLQQFSNVKAVFSGHVHQQSFNTVGPLSVYTSPSTCFQFLSRSHDFAIADQPPGYRWVDLYDNGEIETGVEFLEHFRQSADQRCLGY